MDRLYEGAKAIDMDIGPLLLPLLGVGTAAVCSGAAIGAVGVVAAVAGQAAW